MVWKTNLRHGATLGAWPELERCVIAIELLETRNGVLNADASRRPPPASRLRARPVVAHADHNLSVVARRLDLNASHVLDSRHAVPDRVLNDRLQHEVRHERIANAVVDPALDTKAALKADAHDVDVPIEQLELSRQLDLLIGRAFHRMAQQI